MGRRFLYKKMTVPYPFQQAIKTEYPKDNFVIFEQWLMDKVDHPDYLPVNWCGFFVNNNYGNNPRAMRHLQTYLDRLEKKKYWTVTQYDLGAECGGKINLPKDLKVFGSGGGRVDFPIPLICHPHGRIGNNKDIFASFIGSKTHPIRNKILELYSDHVDWIVTDMNYENKTFCDVLSRSVFAICPRGFGLTSFRICEALEQGSVPIYISDQWISPFNLDFNSYGVLVHSSEISQLDQILASITPEQLESKRKHGRFVYEKYFTFEGCRRGIIENL